MILVKKLKKMDTHLIEHDLSRLSFPVKVVAEVHNTISADRILHEVVHAVWMY